MSKTNIEDVYHLSPAQEGILFHCIYSSDPDVYVTQLSYRLQNVNADLLEQAWHKMIERHAILRTAFVWRDLSKTLQVVGARVKLPVDKRDWRGLSLTEQQQQLDVYLNTDRQTGFNFSKAPLMRIALLQLTDHCWQFIWTHHHLILDGWSIALIINEVRSIYTATLNNEQLNLERGRPFRDYIGWLQDQDASGAEQFWRESLKDFVGTKPRRELQSAKKTEGEISKHTERWIALTEDETSALKTTAGRYRLTLNTMIQGAWALLLCNFHEKRDIVFGVTVSGRPPEIEGIETMVGVFINVIPLRVKYSENDRLHAWLQDLQQRQMEMRQYEHIPLSKLLRWIGMSQSAQLLESILTVQNYPVAGSDNQSEREFNAEDIRVIARNNYPLTTIVSARDTIVAQVKYDDSRFSAGEMDQILRNFVLLLKKFTLGIEFNVASLEDLLTETKRREQSSDRLRREEESFNKFRQTKIKPMILPERNLIKTKQLEPGRQFLMVIEPLAKDIDFIDWAKHNQEYIETTLTKHGAILFRNCNLGSTTEFERFASAVCPELFGEYGDLPREGIRGKVYGSTPYPSGERILFHNESSHLHRWPRKIWFYCVTAAAQGGETPIVDSREIYRLLDPAIKEEFRRRKIMYVRNYIDGLDVSWREFFRTNDKSAVEKYCKDASMDFEWKSDSWLKVRRICPAIINHPISGEFLFFNQIQLHHVLCLPASTRDSLLSVYSEQDLPRNVYYGDGSPIGPDVINHICQLYESAAVTFPWRETDVLMLDNMLAAHGRNSFAGERKIVVAMGEMITEGQVLIRNYAKSS